VEMGGSVLVEFMLCKTSFDSISEVERLEKPLFPNWAVRVGEEHLFGIESEFSFWH